MNVSVFDVNINCSTGTETSSLAISEGLSIGKPGIVSDYGGNPNMIINEKTGYIFRQNDEIDLSQRIIHLAKSPDLLKYMSKMAVQDYFDRFSAERMARQYEEIYNNMIMK